MRISLNKTRLIIILLYLIAYFLLLYGYSEFVAPIFGHEGFEFEPDRIKIFQSLVAVLFFAMILPTKLNKPSDLFVSLQFLFPVLSMLVLYSSMKLPQIYMFFTLLAFTIVCVVRRIPLTKIKGNMIPEHIINWGLLIIVFIYILCIILLGGLRYFNLDLLRVYEFRDIVSENLPGIFGYFSAITSGVLLPFLLLLSVHRRQWFIAALAIGGSVMMSGLTNEKAPLFFPMIVLGIYYIILFKRQNAIALLLTGYIVIILLALLIEPILSDDISIIMVSLVLRRIYYTPSMLNFNYYDFFSTHPHTMFAESKLSLGLIDYPYSLPATNLIGYNYLNSVDASANTGWLGTSYMQLGFVGMIIYALIIGLLLGLIDVIAKRKDIAISVGILFIPLLTLFMSSDLPTAMLTHGLLFALFLAWACQLKQRIEYLPMLQLFKGSKS